MFSDIFGYFRVFWLFLVLLGNFGYSCVFSGIFGSFWYFGYFGVFLGIFVYSGVLLGIFRYFRVFSFILVYSRVWNVLECSGLCRYVQFVFSFEHNLYYVLISPVLCGKMGAYVYDIYLFDKSFVK